jgi:hypothetical protein
MLNLTDIGRSHPIGEIRDGKISIIVRFLTYRQRHMVFSKKKELKGHVDKTFITENLVLQAFFLGCLFCFSLNLSDHFGFYFEFPEELMHLCCAVWFLDEVAYIHQLF